MGVRAESKGPVEGTRGLRSERFRMQRFQLSAKALVTCRPRAARGVVQVGTANSRMQNHRSFAMSMCEVGLHPPKYGPI